MGFLLSVQPLYAILKKIDSKQARKGVRNCSGGVWMKAQEIIALLNGYLHTATKTLADWLDGKLPFLSENWWEACVLSVLDEAQLKRISDGDRTLARLDLAQLLTITDRNWFNLREKYRLNTQDRRTITALRPVRNRWSHCDSSLPGKELVEQDLEALYVFFECLSAPHALLGDIRRSQETVRQAEFASDASPEPSAAAPTREAVVPSDIAQGCVVCLRGSRSEKGVVLSGKPVDGAMWYEVFINGGIRSFRQDQLLPVEKGSAVNAVTADGIRDRLTAFQVRNPSAGSLYSLNSARIDFVPYQFRPALKIIQSDQPRLLVADSVGVGKTIEAGLIMKELQARSGAESVLVICPKPLVAERKWELEMRRFDEDFTQLDGEALRRAISDTDRDGTWPDRHSKTILPYSLFTEAILTGHSGRGRKRHLGLLDLKPAPHFDLVIVDEAHHIRNRNTYAYEGVEFFCRNAGAVVLLTATPVQTSDDNLYTLLNLLRPDVVTDPGTFRLMSRPNQYINQAVHTVRSAADQWQQKTKELLDEACRTQWGGHVIRPDPRYAEIVMALEQPHLEREERVKLISGIEGLHSFFRMINRTRRQDIQDFCVRRSHTLEVPFTDAQRQLHDGLLDFEAQALSALHGDLNVVFMMSTLRRQAASCIFGLAPLLQTILNRRLQTIWDDPDFDVENRELESEGIRSTLGELSTQLLQLAAHLPEEDPKFDAMMQAIRQKQERGNNKIILFSSFRHTLAYLRGKLEAQGLRVAQIDGGVKDEDRLALRERFHLERGHEEALDILLFTEVGCEGLDYQFCDMMVNYDLPWNPMRIEQRIGRIDRRGQRSEVVNIYNMITADTIDADVYHRCLERIGVFEASIGECAQILGNITKSIQDISQDPRLTDAERQEKLETMADNEVRKVQELRRLEQEEHQFFGFDLSAFTMNREIQEAENLWVSPEALQDLVQDYLSDLFGKEHYIQGAKPLKNLRLSGENRRDLLEACRRLAPSRTQADRKWEWYLKSGEANCPVTFDGECAAENREALFITAGHPLVRQAAEHFAGEQVWDLTAAASCEGVEAGQYPYTVYAWEYRGLYPQHRLVAVCEDPVLQDRTIELLRTAQDASAAMPGDDVWDKLEARQRRLWSQSLEAYQKHAAADRAFKLESLQYNFENQRRELEAQLQEASEERIRRMYSGQLRSSEETYREKLRELDRAVEQSDIYTRLIARGVMVIG